MFIQVSKGNYCYEKLMALDLNDNSQIQLDLYKLILLEPWKFIN